MYTLASKSITADTADTDNVNCKLLTHFLPHLSSEKVLNMSTHCLHTRHNHSSIFVNNWKFTVKLTAATATAPRKETKANCCKQK